MRSFLSHDEKSIFNLPELKDGINDSISSRLANVKGKGKGVQEKKRATEVSVAYKINCVSSINPISSDYEIDCKVFFFWMDEKAIGLKEGNLDMKTVKELKLFDPDVMINNQHNLVVSSEEIRVVDTEVGEIKLSIQYKGTLFITDMNLRLFPFDCQNLQVEIRPKKLDESHVVFVPKPKEDCAFDNHNIHEWDVLGHFMKETRTDPALSTTKKVYSTMFIIIQARRQSGWFVNNVMVTSFMLVIFCWLTFLMELDARDSKLQVITNIIIASIANKFVVQDQIPKVSYRTLVDIYTDLCFFSEMFTTLCVYIIDITNYHADKIYGGFETVYYLNIGLFLLNAACFIIFHIYLHRKLSNVDKMVEKWKRMGEKMFYSSTSFMDSDNSLEASFLNVGKKISLMSMQSLYKETEMNEEKMVLLKMKGIQQERSLSNLRAAMNKSKSNVSFWGSAYSSEDKNYAAALIQKNWRRCRTRVAIITAERRIKIAKNMAASAIQRFFRRILAKPPKKPVVCMVGCLDFCE